jgi:hypothetical protein
MIVSAMLDFILRPLRSVLGPAEHEMAESAPIAETEDRIPDVVNAVHRATDSIATYAKGNERLATSVEPLTGSFNRLTSTMTEPVSLLAQMIEDEHLARRLEHSARDANGAGSDRTGPDRVATWSRLVRLGLHAPQQAFSCGAASGGSSSNCRPCGLLLAACRVARARA